MFLPKHIFLTKGVGRHKEELSSFELALRDAGIAACNLVPVSSIFPGGCKLISRKAGLHKLSPGEAIFAVMEGVGTPQAIDTVMKLGMNHPIGPLALADFIGLDVCLAILDVMHEGFGDPKYRACPLLRRMVAAGHLGRKSGQGFYTY